MLRDIDLAISELEQSLARLRRLRAMVQRSIQHDAESHSTSLQQVASELAMAMPLGTALLSLRTHGLLSERTYQALRRGLLEQPGLLETFGDFVGWLGNEQRPPIRRIGRGAVADLQELMASLAIEPIQERRVGERTETSCE